MAQQTYFATVTVQRVCGHCRHRYAVDVSLRSSTRSGIDAQAKHHQETPLAFCPKCNRLSQAFTSKFFPEGIKHFIATSYAIAMEEFADERGNSDRYLPWALGVAGVVGIGAALWAFRMPNGPFRPGLFAFAGFIALILPIGCALYAFEKRVWSKGNAFSPQLLVLLNQNTDATLEKLFSSYDGLLMLSHLESTGNVVDYVGDGRTAVRLWMKLFRPLSRQLGE